MNPRDIKVAFASCTQDLIAPFVERFAALRPDLELYVVSEFPPPAGRWIPYAVERGFTENRRRCREVIGDRRVRLAGLVLEPGAPYKRLRMLAIGFGGHRTLFFNEHLNHFALRPHSIPTIARHFAWRIKASVIHQVHPGGELYTFLWRLRHPSAFRRPVATLLATVGGRIAAVAKTVLEPHAVMPEGELPSGITVVIPSRNGRELLEKLLPVLFRELEGLASEVIVVDNGSDDNSAEWLRNNYPADVTVAAATESLSFARAVNRGLFAARYSHVLLLNNDMMLHEGFFHPLRDAFRRVPDLFCATAQIFFPEGRRREETGKAVIAPIRRRVRETQLPIYCAQPIEGEDHTYVLYGSGGCSLLDTAKVRALGGLGEMFEPAYVEDLDLGFRAWRCGWPTVFVSGSRVTHEHRATTSRYYSDEELEFAVERNYLRFLARSIGDRRTFQKYWADGVRRLTLRAVYDHSTAAVRALETGRKALGWVERPLSGRLSDEMVFAIGSGDVAVFPGKAAAGKPVVLVASSYSPFPLAHGGAVRMYNLMMRAAAEFDQVLVTFVDELRTPEPELLAICVEVVQVRRVGTHLHPFRGRPDVVEDFDRPAFHAALRQTVSKWQPALAQLEFTQMAQYAEHCAPAKTVMVEHDVTIDLYRQLLEHDGGTEVRNQLAYWEDFERRAWSRVHCVVTMSEKDHGAIEGAARVVTIPNGVDLARFTPGAAAPEPNRVLFIGSFAHLPNVLGFRFFMEQVWPLLQGINARLHVIAGSRPEYYLDLYRDRVRLDLTRPDIELESFVADVRPAYERAAVVVAPLLASAGTNIKIMEAMAMGKAIVSTSGGVNGLDVEPGRDVMVEDDPALFADALRELLLDEDARKSLERQARRTVERTYGWDRIAARQSTMYRTLIAG